MQTRVSDPPDPLVPWEVLIELVELPVDRAAELVEVLVIDILTRLLREIVAEVTGGVYAKLTEGIYAELTVNGVG